MRLALAGRDVSRSLSPQMHAFILKSFGETCTYDLVSVPPEGFALCMEQLFSYDGFNVTVPYKEAILPYLSELCGDAEKVRSVNTVACGRRGYNTDGFGFALMLKNAGFAAKGKKALVLGTGGAGKSVVSSLAESGASVFAYEKDLSRVSTFHELYRRFTPLEEIPLAPFDLIVNCTGVGMHKTAGKTPEVRCGGKTAPVGEELLSLCGVAADLIYEPAESEFLRIAKRLKRPALSGEAMLFYQAYGADCIFTGRTSSPEEAGNFYKRYKETR